MPKQRLSTHSLSQHLKLKLRAIGKDWWIRIKYFMDLNLNRKIKIVEKKQLDARE